MSPILPLAGHEREVWFWPVSEVASLRFEVSLMGRSGLDLLTLSFSDFDPKRTFRVAGDHGIDIGGRQEWDPFSLLQAQPPACSAGTVLPRSSGRVN